MKVHEPTEQPSVRWVTALAAQERITELEAERNELAEAVIRSEKRIAELEEESDRRFHAMDMYAKELLETKEQRDRLKIVAENAALLQHRHGSDRDKIVWIMRVANDTLASLDHPNEQDNPPRQSQD